MDNEPLILRCKPYTQQTLDHRHYINLIVDQHYQVKKQPSSFSWSKYYMYCVYDSNDQLVIKLHPKEVELVFYTIDEDREMKLKSLGL